jgi:hypothetical protein
MITPRQEIMEAVVTALKNKILVGSDTVPVYSFAPVNESRFIWLAAVRGSEDWTKQGFGGDYYFDLNCIDRVGQGAESMSVCLSMAQQVVAELMPKPAAKLNLSNGVRCLRLQLVNDTDLSERTDDGVEFRVVLEFKVMVELASADPT